MKIALLTAALSLAAMASLSVVAAQAASGPLCSDAKPASLATPVPIAVSASHSPGGNPSGTCSAQTETDYYNDASHTPPRVGVCTITCMQWGLGNKLPVFGGGGACSGTETSFPVYVFHQCACPP
jgi:hypothetical protein